MDRSHEHAHHCSNNSSRSPATIICPSSVAHRTRQHRKVHARSLTRVLLQLVSPFRKRKPTRASARHCRPGRKPRTKVALSWPFSTSRLSPPRTTTSRRKTTRVDEGSRLSRIKQSPTSSPIKPTNRDDEASPNGPFRPWTSISFRLYKWKRPP